MYNKIILVGNLTRDIEVRYTPSGTAIGNTAIATSRKFKTQTGQQKEEVLFVDITFFGRTAEIANQYLRKGSKLLVEGRLKLDQWTAQDGTKRSRHSVTVENMTMLGSRDDAQVSGGYNNPSTSNNNSYAQKPAQQSSNSYQAPSQNTYNTQSAPSNNAPKQNQASYIPEIDINEDEIPF